MPGFEPTGELLSDLSNAIATGTVMFIRYIDKKGNPSERRAGPIEIRNDKVYVADLDKMALRLFNLDGIQSFEVLDETFDKDSLQLT